MPSFTIESADLWNEGPVVEVSLGLAEEAEQAILRAGGTVPPPVHVSALVDTGASHSLVQDGVLAPLGLHPVGTTTINTPSSQGDHCALYAVRLTLPNGWLETTVIQAPPAGLQGQNIQALLGRDVLRYGILIYMGHIGQFTLSV